MILKVERKAGWDFMQWAKHYMRGIHGSGVLQQWQETIKCTVDFVSL